MGRERNRRPFADHGGDMRRGAAGGTAITDSNPSGDRVKYAGHDRGENSRGHAGVSQHGEDLEKGGLPGIERKTETFESVITIFIFINDVFVRKANFDENSIFPSIGFVEKIRV